MTDAPAVAVNRRLICPTLRPTIRIARSRRGRGHDDAHDFRLFLNAGGPPVVYRAAVSELVAILARPTDDGRQVVCAVWFGEDWAALVSGGARPSVGEVFWLGLFSTRHSRCRCAPRPSRRVARHQDLRGCDGAGAWCAGKRHHARCRDGRCDLSARTFSAASWHGMQSASQLSGSSLPPSLGART